MFGDLKRVDEIDGAGLREIPPQIVESGRPMVIQGAFANWPIVQAAAASDQAAVDYLNRFYNRRPVSVLASHPDNKGRFFYRADAKSMNFHCSTQLLNVVLGGILQETGADEQVAIAVQAISAPDCLPGIEDENPNPLVPPDNNARLWIGNAVTVAPHFDVAENIACVVAGRRRFILFPPEQTANLYPGPMDVTPANVPISMVSLDEPDLDRFPRYADALRAAFVAELGPGDAIYIPYLWWHGVQSLANLNILMNYWWNRLPATAGYPLVQLLQLAVVMFAGMPETQRQGWRHLFEQYVFEGNGDPMAALDPVHRYQPSLLEPSSVAKLKATLREVLG